MAPESGDPLASLRPALMRELHLLTRDGKLNQDARRKLKQITHLYQLLAPALKSGEGTPRLFDMGAGKSYLGFLLYDLHFRERTGGEVVSVETRPELVARGRELARSCGFERMSFLESSIRDAEQKVQGTVDVVTALHACDTATDEALVFGVRRQARFVALVPCCQAEVARLLDALPTRDDLYPLWRHPIERREFGAHLTNVFRGLVLESLGYRVRVTELVGWEHSLKNELILAEKVQGSNGQARRQLSALLEKIPVRPGLLDALDL